MVETQKQEVTELPAQDWSCDKLLISNSLISLVRKLNCFEVIIIVIALINLLIHV